VHHGSKKVCPVSLPRLHELPGRRRDASQAQRGVVPALVARCPAPRIIGRTPCAGTASAGRGSDRRIEMLVTNIHIVTRTDRSRTEATRHLLTEVALGLFERDGFNRTTTASIAAAAGVSEMTFFRHFGTKQGVLFDDPYDPAIVHAIAGRRDGRLVQRIAAGMRQAWAELPEPAEAQVRRRIAIVATTPELRAGMRANMERTEAAVVQQLVADGSNAFEARVAAAAVMAGVAAGLLEWATSSGGRLHESLVAALEIVGGSNDE